MTTAPAFVALVLGVFAQLAPLGAGARQPVVLAQRDALELAETLAKATQAHNICYGWQVSVDDRDDRTVSGIDVGSNLGVGRPVTDSCSRYIAFFATIVYTSRFSEQEDYASFSVESNVPGAPSGDDLRRLGITTKKLLSDRHDLALIEATSSLPLLAAERGLGPPLPLQPNLGTIPPGDQPAGTPGSDWTRKHGSSLAVGAVLVVLGGAWGLVALAWPSLRTD